MVELHLSENPLGYLITKESKDVGYYIKNQSHGVISQPEEKYYRKKKTDYDHYLYSRV